MPNSFPIINHYLQVAQDLFEDKDDEYIISLIPELSESKLTPPELTKKYVDVMCVKQQSEQTIGFTHFNCGL